MVMHMLFNLGDIVTRKSHNNDTFFEIVSINNNIAYLKGINIRLEADSGLDDLNKVDSSDVIDDSLITETVTSSFKLDRSEFFYLPGKILHIDGDDAYLKRCMNFYDKLNIMSYGLCLKENDISVEIKKYLEKLNPDIVVITGHDAYYKKKGKMSDINNYKNTKDFVEAVKVARRYEKNQDKLIIIAGACQSNYEELIKAGATFASSPKRINIHALDPAIIASYIALYDRNKVIDLMDVLSKTKFGSDGIGGVRVSGCMFVGYPR